MDTFWDQDLSYVLGPALGAYESERITGQDYGNDEFQQSVKNYIPIHHVFKVFYYYYYFLLSIYMK